MIKIKKILTITILFSFFFVANGNTLIKDSLFATVGGKAITNSDIINEIKIILILTGKSFSEDKRDRLQAAAVQAVIKRKVKQIEIENYNFSQYNENDLDLELNNLAKNLGLDLDTLKSIFETNKIDFSIIKEQIKTELLWNGLIFEIYKNKLSINIEEINEQLKLVENKKEIEEYLISEIIVKPSQEENIEDQISNIKNRIQSEGFENVALDISISETGIKGGDLGWVDTNVISNQLRTKIVNTPVGKLSEPTLLPQGILIFKVNDKRKKEQTINLEDVKNQLVNAEKTKILNMHSLQHYDNIKRSISINYY